MIDLTNMQFAVAYLLMGLALGGLISGAVLVLEMDAAWRCGMDRRPRNANTAPSVGLFIAASVIFWPAIVVGYLVFLVLCQMCGPTEGGGE